MKNYKFTYYLLVVLLAISTNGMAQEKDSLALKKQYNKLVYEAQKDLQNNNFAQSEAKLREAIALNPNNPVAKYNLGTAYYNKKLNNEAQLRFKQATGIAKNKQDKHKAFHNLGNTFMNRKNYKAAVESYKNALRNNPKDDQTRYNLALAKKLLEEQQKNNKNNKDNKDNKDKNKDKNQKDNKDNKDKRDNKDKDKKDGDKKDDKNDKGKDKQDKKEGDKNKDKGKPDDKKGENKNKKQGDEKKQQQPVPGKLSPQQIKSILQAMNNEEKKIQKKINAKKEKGVKIKTDKDW